MPIFVFQCLDKHVTERLAPREIGLIFCACGKVAARSQVNHIAVTGFTPVPRDQRNYRQSYREFTEARDEVGDFYDRKRYNGDPAQEPDYTNIARAKVNHANQG